MTPFRMLLLVPLLLLSLTACNRSQPSGVPESTAVPSPAPVQPVEQPPAAPVADAAPVEAAPPPLDSPIPAYAKTGYPDCDDYLESYRQCLNSRLGSDERKSHAHELHEVFRSISANIARGTDPARVAALCKKSRKLAAGKLSELGCAL